MRISTITDYNILAGNSSNTRYRGVQFNLGLVSGNDTVVFTPSFKSNKYMLLKYFGTTAFNIFKKAKEIQDPKVRMMTVQTITAGAAVMAAATAGIFAQMKGIEHTILNAITLNMCTRISGCYAYDNAVHKTIGAFLSTLGGQIVGVKLAKEVLSLYPGLGNAANSIITAVLHEITGNIWIKLLEDWYKTKPVRSDGIVIHVKPEELEKMRKHLQKEKSIQEMVEEYNTPQIRKLIEVLQKELIRRSIIIKEKKMYKGLLINNSDAEYMKMYEEKLWQEVIENLFQEVVPMIDRTDSLMLNQKIKQKNYLAALKAKITNAIDNLSEGLSELWIQNENKTKIRM